MRSNDSDAHRNSRKKLKTSKRRSPRLLARLLGEEEVASGIRVLLQTKLLPWRDALALGSTCKTAQDTWMMTRDVHMLPLLNVLEKILGHDAYEDEDELSLRGILLDEDYSNFSIAGKCEDLAFAIGLMVTNMRSHPHFCLDDPSNRLENIECDPVGSGWSMGLGHETETRFLHKFHRRGTLAMECDPVAGWFMGLSHETETRFLHKFHRRGTLAMNIAIFDFVLHALKQDGDYYFNDVFLGMDNADLGGGSCYDLTICEGVASMFPFRDKDLAEQMRMLYPSASVLELLGPALTKRVVLAEPFFRFLPPLSARDEVDFNSASDNNEEDTAPLFQNLPTPLEPLTEEIIIENGMGNWLDPNHTTLYT
eukprot:CAMPEP_0194125198 /NCGR_PEP_ID=MMETSP0150-20130528/59337_1 /TAXON_ID=122233 /ORGANISM="Chaetoceros debilis, Strain MM31A-1" /LENGTH=366 /DNA_ID=CAMNT_0038818995 /DNA_START=109 /DNA_END=1210 /DNA_ORIENTATION=-